MSSGRYPSRPILIVDDEPAVIQALSAQLKTNGIDNLIGCDDSRKVMELLHTNDVEIVLLDLAMPHISGKQLLDQVRTDYPYIPVIVVTAANEVQTAVECMRAGAFDYMVKAIEENRLVSGVRRAVEIRELKREHSDLRSRIMAGELSYPQAFSEIITKNSKMKSIFLYTEAVAKTGEPVLITGETGVGKNLIARAVHEISGAEGKSIQLNTAGQDDQTFSDTLFGHKRGAFTGADSDRDGFIHSAKGGTLFLDEIGDLSAGSQLKLLQLLDTGVYYPLGSDLPKRSDARIVLATNRNLQELMDKNQFRKDLYYRISTHEITIPPLRERMEDLPLLLEHFINKACEAYGKGDMFAAPELVSQLLHCRFPGNVRELEVHVKDAVAVADPAADTLVSLPRLLESAKSSTPIENAAPDAGALLQFGPVLPTIKQADDLLVDEALRRCGGTITRAARLLGISHQALSKRIQRRKDLQP
jgi:DNA-binding NtrC family response regulator